MRMLSLALRNLFRNTRRTLITLSAIASGLACVFMMVGLQAGSYADMLRVGISSMAGHVVVQARGWQEEREQDQVVRGATEVQRRLQRALPGATVTPRLYLGGLLTSPSSSAGVGLRGVDPASEARVDTLDDSLVEGGWLEEGDDRGIVIGRALADALGVGLGDKVVYLGQARGQSEMVSRMFRVSGIFRTGGAELDSLVAVVTLAAGQELLEQPDVAHQIAVHLPDPTTSREATAVVRAEVGAEGREVLEWPQALPDIVSFIQLDKVSGDVMMGVMGVIVAMGVLNTVLMSVLERTKEFGVLLALGMRPRRLASMVLLETALMGVFGSLLGAFVGSLIVWPMVTYGIDYSAYMGETMEMEGLVLSTRIHGAWDVTRMGAYVVATVFVTVLAGVWPAWHITRLSPVDAMRAP